DEVDREAHELHGEGIEALGLSCRHPAIVDADGLPLDIATRVQFPAELRLVAFRRGDQAQHADPRHGCPLCLHDKGCREDTEGEGHNTPDGAPPHEYFRSSSSYWMPNAAPQPRLAAAARHERRLPG